MTSLIFMNYASRTDLLHQNFTKHRFGEMHQPLWRLDDSTPLEFIKVRLDEALSNLTLEHGLSAHGGGVQTR